MKYEVKYDLSFLEGDLRELLKKLKKHNTYASQLENEIILYKLEIERLKERLDIAQTAYLAVNEKISKAIEYIEKSLHNNQPYYEYLFGDENGEVENLDKLLDILKGE